MATMLSVPYCFQYFIHVSQQHTLPQVINFHLEESFATIFYEIHFFEDFVEWGLSLTCHSVN